MRQRNPYHEKQLKYFSEFKNNMNDGIEYYKILFADVMELSEEEKNNILNDLGGLEVELVEINPEVLVEQEQVLIVAV